jgi:hypothetical protein
MIDDDETINLKLLVSVSDVLLVFLIGIIFEFGNS